MHERVRTGTWQSDMLREVQRVSQPSGESPRRWFEDDTLDLVVWQSADGTIVGFQLCYEKGTARERALTWLQGSGFSHLRVDDGEDRPGKYKMTPILVADGSFDQNEVVRRLEDASGGIDPVVARAVRDIIARYPQP